MAMIVCYLKNFFLPYTAKPIKPEPKRIMLAGSGTDATPRFSANNKPVSYTHLTLPTSDLV